MNTSQATQAPSAPASGSAPDAQTILIISAGRGLGLAMAGELSARGWHVIGTVRPGRPRTGLHDLAGEPGSQVEIETVDINDQAQVAALRQRLAGRRLDILFVNSGITTADQGTRIGEVTTEEFTSVMVTNALSPMRVIEALQDLVPATGLIGAMSSGQGSIAGNTRGLREVYRGSKAALNMFMRSFAARQPDRAMVVLAPGWIRTGLGGPDAPYTVEETIPDLVSVLLAQPGNRGLRFLDRFGHEVPW